MSRRLIRWLAVLLIVIGSSACRSPEEATPAPEELVRMAVDRMAALPGFSFSIDRSGGPAYLDPGGTISFSRAEGDYVAPHAARAAVRVVVPGLVAEINVIAIDDRYWETNFLTREWVEVPGEGAFNPAVLFDAESGLGSILLEDLSGWSFEGTLELEDIPGRPLHLITGQLAADGLYQLSYGLIGPQVSETRLWIHPETNEIYRLLITEPPASAEVEASVWQIDFWDFGTISEIEPP